MLTVVRDRIQAMIDDGKGLEEVVAAKPTAEFDERYGDPDHAGGPRLRESRPVIRITFLLRRKADLSLEAFRDYWLNEHGPLVASVASKIKRAALRAGAYHRSSCE